MKNELCKPPQVELTYVNDIPDSQRVTIITSKNGYDVLMQCYNFRTIEHHMEVKAILMNNASQVLGCVEIGSGGTVKSPIDIKPLLQAVLLSNATSIIVSRNSPSGTMLASQEDRYFVERCKNVCSLINISLFDYIIVAKDKFYSFADEGSM